MDLQVKLNHSHFGSEGDSELAPSDGESSAYYGNAVCFELPRDYYPLCDSRGASHNNDHAAENIVAGDSDSDGGNGYNVVTAADQLSQGDAGVVDAGASTNPSPVSGPSTSSAPANECDVSVMRRRSVSRLPVPNRSAIATKPVATDRPAVADGRPDGRRPSTASDVPSATPVQSYVSRYGRTSKQRRDQNFVYDNG